MAKKKKGGGEGGANWMDTYGDMVTLLLCFFVLLYSMSSISEDKWKAIITSFNPNAIIAATDPEGNSGPFADPEVGMDYPGLNEFEQSQNEIDNMIEELYAALQQYSKQDGLDSAVSVSMDGGLIYLTLMDRAMFVADEPDLLPESYVVLDGICSILEQSKNAIEEIRVVGHTAQGNPNHPNEVPGDRRLSSERATEVTIYIQEHTTIHPARLSSVGQGQWHPVAPNIDEATRAPNRRVELEISARNLEQEALGNALSRFTTGGGTQAGQSSADQNQ